MDNKSNRPDLDNLNNSALMIARAIFESLKDNVKELEDEHEEADLNEAVDEIQDEIDAIDVELIWRESNEDLGN